jgi:Tfp pilus assembly protein PilN
MIPRPSSGGHDPYRAGPAPEESVRGWSAPTGTAVLPPDEPSDVGGRTGRPVEWARVPRVNLLPPEVIEERRFRRTRTVLGWTVLAVVLACGLVTFWEQTRVDAARTKLEATRTETLALQRQQSQFAEVPKVSAELDAARAARERALGTDVLWYRFLTDLAVNTPEGAVLQSVTVTMTGSATAPPPASGLSPTGLGSVKVSGEAKKFTDVAAWLDAAARVNGLTGTTLQSAVRADTTGAASAGRITYAGGAVISTAALSHRYDRKAS